MLREQSKGVLLTRSIGSSAMPRNPWFLSLSLSPLAFRGLMTSRERAGEGPTCSPSVRILEYGGVVPFKGCVSWRRQARCNASVILWTLPLCVSLCMASSHIIHQLDCLTDLICHLSCLCPLSPTGQLARLNAIPPFSLSSQVSTCCLGGSMDTVGWAVMTLSLTSQALSPCDVMSALSAAIRMAAQAQSPLQSCVNPPDIPGVDILLVA